MAQSNGFHCGMASGIVSVDQNSESWVAGLRGSREEHQKLEEANMCNWEEPISPSNNLAPGRQDFFLLNLSLFWGAACLCSKTCSGSARAVSLSLRSHWLRWAWTLCVSIQHSCKPTGKRNICSLNADTLGDVVAERTTAHLCPECPLCAVFHFPDGWWKENISCL